jgi:hypothetical protein
VGQLHLERFLVGFLGGQFLLRRLRRGRLLLVRWFLLRRPVLGWLLVRRFLLGQFVLLGVVARFPDCAGRRALPRR